jgi:hypothetical protein
MGMIRVLWWIVQGITGLRKSKRYYWGVNFLVKYKGSIRVVSDFEDFYIDHYEDGKLKILYKIDLCSEVLPDDVLPKTSEEFDAVWNSPEHFKFIGGACEVSDWLCIKPYGLKPTYYIAFLYRIYQQTRAANMHFTWNISIWE